MSDETPLRAAGVLLIGASSRNLGRTALTSRVVQRVSRSQRVVAIRVTTSSGDNDVGVRGNSDCGACAPRSGDFAIETEDSLTGKKDTAKLRTAGASACYWVRTKRAHLRVAWRALVARLEPETAIVCESTGLRAVIVPDVFLLLSNQVARSGKAAAQRVWGDADRVCLWNGQHLDLDVEALSFSEKYGRWGLRREATAIVLAGGTSRRMGRDKARIMVDERPMLESIVARLRPHFAEILISAGHPRDYAELGVPVVVDRAPGGGPLVGVASALAVAAYDTTFVCACDNPDVDVDLAARMLRAEPRMDLVVPRANGRSEPLFAVYRRSALPHIEANLAAGKRKMTAVFERCRTLWVDLEPAEVPINLNTPEDLEAFRRQRHNGRG